MKHLLQQMLNNIHFGFFNASKIRASNEPLVSAEASGDSDAQFPLTPALSLGERENRRQPFNDGRFMGSLDVFLTRIGTMNLKTCKFLKISRGSVRFMGREVSSAVAREPGRLAVKLRDRKSSLHLAALIKFAFCFLTLTALPFAGRAKLNVVASTPDLASIAKEIGCDRIDITTLAKPTEDPHFVDAKPSFIMKLSRADVLIEGGAELEIGWLPALLDQARNPKVAPGAPGHIACSQGIGLLEVPTTLDRSRGDIHAAGNPHYLVDPINAKIVAQHITDAFCALDEKSSAAYRANLQRFTEALDAKLVEWQRKLGPFKGQQIVAYHNSWLYFGDRFGLKIDLFLEPKPGIPPTPTHLAEVITKMRADKVHVILVDPYLNRRTAETVADKTGATVVDVSQFPGGIKGTEGGYIPLMDYLVNAIARALAAGK